MDWYIYEKCFYVHEEKHIDFITEENRCVYWRIDDGKLLDKLPNHITHLIFFEYYNDPKPIPNHITHLKFSMNYNQSTPLPNSITHLTFSIDYNQPTPLPNSITHLEFGADYNQPTPLPNSITHLIFGMDYNQPTPLPNSITHLTFGYNYNQPTPLPNGIIQLTFHSKYNQPTPLPNSIKILSLGWDYNQPTPLPNSVKNLRLGHMYDQDTPLPNQLEEMFVLNCNSIKKLPKSLKYLTLEIQMFIYSKNKWVYTKKIGNKIIIPNHVTINKIKSKKIIRADLDEMKDDERLLFLLKHGGKCYYEDMVELFNQKLPYNQQYLYNALESGDTYKVELCLGYGCFMDEKAIELASKSKNKEIVKLAIQK